MADEPNRSSWGGDHRAAHYRQDGPSHPSRRRPLPLSGRQRLPLGSDGEFGVRASAVDDGSIGRLSAGQGARYTNRRNASEAADKALANAGEHVRRRRLKGGSRPEYGRSGGRRRKPVGLRRIVMVVVPAILVLLVVLGVARCVAGPVGSDAGGSQQSGSSSSARVVPEGAVEYSGVIFTLQQNAQGKWVVMADDGINEPAETFGVDGQAVRLLLFNNILIVPENRDSGWDVVAYALGADSVPTLVKDADGNDVTGSGTVTDATVSGSTLTIADSAGATTDIVLE